MMDQLSIGNDPSAASVNMVTVMLRITTVLMALVLCFQSSLGQAWTVENGDVVAQRLNARYADTAAMCSDGSAAYYCNGVLVRIARSWLPSAGQLSRNALSFSYLRADEGTRQLWLGGLSGFIVKPFSAHTGYPLTLRCMFPYDGATNSRPNGCDEQGVPTQPPGSSRPCDEQGINTPSLWVEHFESLEWKNANCSFKVDAASFDLSLNVRNFFPDPVQRIYWNEAVVAAWPEDAVPQLPIEALFFLSGELGVGGLLSAQEMQLRFHQESERWLPIISMNLSSGSETVFAFKIEHQTPSYNPD